MEGKPQGHRWLSVHLVSSTVCKMNNPQDLTWGTEKKEQLVFALDIGTTSSEFGEFPGPQIQRLILAKALFPSAI